MMTAKEISKSLANRVEDIVRYLLPNGKKHSNEWRVGSVDGEKGESLAVHLGCEKPGIWCDFSTGDKGDLLDLWVATRKLTLVDAIKEASHYLGVGQIKFEAHKPLKFIKPILKKSLPIDLTSPVARYLIEERKLNRETVQLFKITEHNNQIIFNYFRDNELVFVKHLSLERKNGKKQIFIEPNCEPCLFGWQLLQDQARTITLCEGEIDAMTLYQYGHPALSVPFGGGSGDKHKWLEYEFDRLSIYDEINLCFDNDEAGEKAVAHLMDRLGRHRCRIVKLPYKDANECLQRGVGKEAIQECFINAHTLDPEELKQASSYANQVVDVFYPNENSFLGYKTPWEKVGEKVLFRPEELSVWTGINGHGKSQFLGHAILSGMKQGARVCIASLELKPKRLLARLTRQISALAVPSESYIHAIHEWYHDKLWLFDLVGTAKSKRLLDVFLYARQRYGIDVFVIDSLMKLDITEDDYKAQKIFMEQLCDFKNQHNCHIHIVVHPRKGADESQAPGKLDTKGTGAITDLADNCFSVWRNKKKEELIRQQSTGRALHKDELEKTKESDCIWSCDKQRNGDWEGRFGFWFHAESLQYLSFEGQKPVQYVDYSSCNA